MLVARASSARKIPCRACIDNSLSQYQSERFARWRKREQGMQMIGHEQKQIRPPQKLLLPMLNGCEDLLGNLREGRLILEAPPAVDRDEIDFLARIDPQRDVVRETHGLEI